MSRAKPFCTRDEARAYFKDKGLSYRNIRKTDISRLQALLRQEIRTSNKNGESLANMRLSEKVDVTIALSGIDTCYLYVNGDYYKRRECISFNRDGFIGFAGWADDGNLNPITRAFVRWVDILAEIYGGNH